MTEHLLPSSAPMSVKACFIETEICPTRIFRGLPCMQRSQHTSKAVALKSKSVLDGVWFGKISQLSSASIGVEVPGEAFHALSLGKIHRCPCPLLASTEVLEQFFLDHYSLPIVPTPSGTKQLAFNNVPELLRKAAACADVACAQAPLR